MVESKSQYMNELVLTGENKYFLFFDKYVDGEFKTTSCKMKDKEWKKRFGILENPSSFFENTHGWKIESNKLKFLIDKYNHDILALYRNLYSLLKDDSSFIDFAISFLLEHDMKYYNHHNVLNIFKMVRNDKFNTTDMKNIFSRLLTEKYEDVINDSKYQKQSDDIIKNTIITLVKEHSEKLKKNPTPMRKWLIGQVMKELKGKCDPLVVKELINLETIEYGES